MQTNPIEPSSINYQVPPGKTKIDKEHSHPSSVGNVNITISAPDLSVSTPLGETHQIEVQDKNANPTLTKSDDVFETTKPKAVAPLYFLQSAELMTMNKELLALRGKIQTLTEDLYLEEVIEQREGEIKRITTEKESLIKQHTKLTESKVVFVKSHFPDDPVLAMAIPQHLDKGMKLFTSGPKERIHRILKEGIVFNPDKAPTGLDPKAQKKAWEVSEMGDRGIYFSLDQPAYLSSGLPRALSCELVKNISGVSIMPISVLLKQHHFTEHQINKAFGRLQNEFDFIQHDGLYPSNTEVVFVRNNNIFRINSQLVLEKSELVEIMIPSSAEIHNSWKPPQQ